MKLRLSYSILSCWEKGDYDGTIMRLRGEWPEPTKPMLMGRDADERWTHEVNVTGRMPVDFGGAKFSGEARTQLKKAFWINDWIQVVGVLDLKEPKIGRDWKYGATSATQYANGYQHKVYQVLYPEMTMFAYHAFNPYVPREDAVTSAYIHLNKESLTDGVEYIITHGSSIRDYIEKNELTIPDRTTP